MLIYCYLIFNKIYTLNDFEYNAYDTVYGEFKPVMQLPK
jgi:hypothetical protein